MKEGETMEAGRELDALVAEKVMGLILCQTSETWYLMHGKQYPEGSLGADMAEVPHYSTDMVWALDVLEKFDTYAVQRWYDPEVPLNGSPFYFSAMVTRFNPEAFGEARRCAAVPLAICLAALEAVKASPGKPSVPGVVVTPPREGEYK